MTIERTLYKRTSTGAVQIWFQEIEGDRYRTTSGQKDGALVTSEWTVCESKNQGRSNETTPEQQARLEVEANYTKKLAQGGYHETIETIDTPNYFKPMLAKEYDDYTPSPSEFGEKSFFSQPKLDGMRCYINSSGMWSRQGKPVISAPHIYEALLDIFNKNPDMSFDGELYNHDLKDNFNKIMSLAKKGKPTQANLDESRALLQYHIYDIPYFSEHGIEYRIERRDEFFADVLHQYSFLIPVQTDKIRDRMHLDELSIQYVNDGYEGQMVRIGGRPYENKRVNHLLKRKNFHEGEFEITGFEEGSGNRSNMAGNVWLKTNLEQPKMTTEGVSFKAGLAGGVGFYKHLWDQRDSLVGTLVTVKYFEPTPDGIPRFPVAKHFHESKTREF